MSDYFALCPICLTDDKRDFQNKEHLIPIWLKDCFVAKRSKYVVWAHAKCNSESGNVLNIKLDKMNVWFLHSAVPTIRLNFLNLKKSKGQGPWR